MHHSKILTHIWRVTARNFPFMRCNCRSRNTTTSLHERAHQFESKKLYQLEEHTNVKQGTRTKRTHQTDRAKYTKPKHQPLGPPFSLFVTCLPGLEPLLLKEIEYLHSNWQDNNHSYDSSKPRIIPGGVKLTAPTLTHLYILRLYLGTASHIYIRLNEDVVNQQRDSLQAQIPPLFRARGFPELERKLKDLVIAQDWKRWLGSIKTKSFKETNAKSKAQELSLQIHVTTSKSKLIHTKAVEGRIRKYIGEVLGLDLDKIDPSNNTESEDTATIRFLVRIERDTVQISLDATSEPIHMRGYRKNPYKAPLREDLAFALLMAGGLNPNWNLKPLEPLLGEASLANPESSLESKVHLFDPCCGSGTIAIEGAAIMARLPPGRNKPAPLKGTIFYNSDLWKDLKTVAALGSKSTKQYIVQVTANDVEKNAIAAAKVNAEHAGVQQCIAFTEGALQNHEIFTSSKSKYTVSTLLIVANPPFGQRLSGANIYKKLARSILMTSQTNSIRYAMICNDPRPMRETGLPLDIKFSTKSGGLSVVAMSGQISKPDA